MVSFQGWWQSVYAIIGGVSIRTKILGIILALTLLLGLATMLQVRLVMTDTLVAEVDKRGHSVVSDLAGRSVDHLTAGDFAAVQSLLSETITNHPDTRYAFVQDATGAVVAHTFADEVPPDLLALAPFDLVSNDQHRHYENYEGQVHDFAMPIAGGQLGLVRLGLAETRLQQIIDRTSQRMFLTALAVAILGVLAAMLLTWLLTRPVVDLVATTEQLRAGTEGVRAPHWADDEIGALSDAFNRMIVDLEQSRETVAEKEATRTLLLSRLIDAQEEERKRIARELHDDIGQALTSLLVGLKVLDQLGDTDAIHHKVAELRQVANQTLQSVRLMSRQLRPSTLDDLGLSAALERYVSEFADRYPELNVDLHCNLPQRLPPTVATWLYRIVQEAMTNAARHSQAGNISVLINQRDKRIYAIIEDDGAGFEVDSMLRFGSSMGLHSMVERSELLGGKLEIESGDAGTTIYVEIPT